MGTAAGMLLWRGQERCVFALTKTNGTLQTRVALSGWRATCEVRAHNFFAYAPLQKVGDRQKSVQSNMIQAREVMCILG